MINVLHLWQGDSPAVAGGGAGSMYRLHSNLRKAGLDSHILCERKTINSPHIHIKSPPSRLESILQRFTSAIGLNDIHRISSWNLDKYSSYQDADVLNFHGLHSGFFSYLALPQITADKPTVITLRDMWCLTGHCAFSYDCKNWKTGCGKCPYLNIHPPVKRDATALEWKLKNWVYKRSNLTLVVLSRWLEEQVKNSMLSSFPVHFIPNGVDSEALTPLDQIRCKYALGIPEEKKVIVFAATNLQSKQKGGDLLLKTLDALPQSLKSEIVLLSFGRQGDQLTDMLDIDAVNLGYIDNVQLKAVAFSAADLFLYPSRAETFGQVILESFACGTPVVSHDIGPLGELVQNDYTGYLAPAENIQDMGEGIIKLLEDTKSREQMKKTCRKLAKEKYSLELEAQRYISLYQNILQVA